MSYILDALKKSQQQRELGQVPALNSLTFEQPPIAGPGIPLWIWSGALLVVLAAALALYMVLRSEASAPAAGAAAPSAATAADPAAPAALATRPDGPSSLAAQGPAEPLPAAPSVAEEPNDEVEPQVLVVPAPPKPGERLPRGADELRRAVLGPEAAPPPIAAPAPASSPPSPPSRPASATDRTPVPEDLIADIEAFKRQVGSDTAAPSKGEDKKPAAPAEDSGPDIGLPAVSPASAALRRRLPDFLMTVHVYDADPQRRFVFINGRKLREQQTSREGLRVEQVLTDGAVLSWNGERFFQPRR